MIGRLTGILLEKNPQQIVLDKAAILADAKPLGISDKPMAKPLAKPAMACNTEELTNRVNDWASAWRHKDYDNYMNFYAANFAPENAMSTDAWQKQRKARLATPGKINLELSGVEVTCDGDKAVAKFKQDYSVTTYKLKKSKDDLGCQVCNAKRVATKGFADVVDKELRFEKQANQWKIVQELVNK